MKLPQHFLTQYTIHSQKDNEAAGAGGNDVGTKTDWTEKGLSIQGEQRGEVGGVVVLYH